MTNTVRNKLLKEMLHVILTFLYIQNALYMSSVQGIHMKIAQIEVSNIRFGKLEDNLRTPFHNIASFTISMTERDLML